MTVFLCKGPTFESSLDTNVNWESGIGIGLLSDHVYNTLTTNNAGLHLR
jgi:hypothetical protein